MSGDISLWLHNRWLLIWRQLVRSEFVPFVQEIEFLKFSSVFSNTHTHNAVNKIILLPFLSHLAYTNLQIENTNDKPQPVYVLMVHRSSHTHGELSSEMEGWMIARTLKDFHILHSKLKEVHEICTCVLDANYDECILHSQTK